MGIVSCDRSGTCSFFRTTTYTRAVNLKTPWRLKTIAIVEKRSAFEAVNSGKPNKYIAEEFVIPACIHYTRQYRKSEEGRGPGEKTDSEEYVGMMFMSVSR